MSINKYIIVIAALVFAAGSIYSQTISAYIASGDLGYKLLVSNSGVSPSIKPIAAFSPVVPMTSLEPNLIVVESTKKEFQWFAGSHLDSETEYYNISLELQTEIELNVQLIDLTGKVFLKDRIHALGGMSSHSVSLSGLKDGVYFLNLSSADNRFARNFKIQKIK